MDYKQIFSDYLRVSKAEEAESTMAKFEAYHTVLQEINSVINLVSRKMPPEEYWTQHFLDSIRILECLDISGKRVLDFGSGGGLPGIPLKLMVPDLKVDLLDSVAKKVKAMQQMVDELALQDVKCIWSRLEDYAYKPRSYEYDYVICRAVGLEERYVKPLKSLLKPQGMLVLYKSRIKEDIAAYKAHLLWEDESELLGQRSYWGILRKDLELPRIKTKKA